MSAGPAARAVAFVLLSAPWLAGCAAGGPAARAAGGGGEPRVREVTARVLRPPPINLHDRGIETLGVQGFEGPSGARLAVGLARQLEADGAFRVVGPASVAERLLKAGLDVGWEQDGSSLRWVHERTAVDALVVGRVERFEVEEREQEKDTLAIEGTGVYGFDRTEEGKLAYRERMAYRRVPLICRTDLGTVGAVYRVWDTRRGEEVATVRHDLSAEVPSFCYRGDVPERLKKQAQSRLLERLFDRLNAQFCGDIVARGDLEQVAFEVLPFGADAPLMHRNELAILYASRGEWRRAADLWHECLADHPDLAAAHYNVAMADRAIGRLTSALEHLGKALAASPRPLYLAAAEEVRARLQMGR